MLLCLDIGNSHIFGGVFLQDTIKLQFRYPTEHACTSDKFGLFLKSVLREYQLDPKNILDICLSSVVPSLEYSITAACIKYFNQQPLVLKSGVKTGLKIATKHAPELGADRIANGVAAIHKFPNKNIIAIDFGTATTTCAINSHREYLGGTIMPGFKLSMDALHINAAKLAPVEIVKPNVTLGKTTETNIQAGLYYSQLGGIKEIIAKLKTEAFNNEPCIIIGTGGFANLFDSEHVFSVIIPDLVLHGLRIIHMKNKQHA